MAGLLFINLALIALLLAVASHRVYGEPLSPVSLFLIINIVSFGMYRMELVPFLPPTGELYFVFVLVLSAFMIGALLADPAVLRTGRSGTIARRKEVDDTVLVRRFLYSTGLLGLIGWAWQAYTFLQSTPLLAVAANLGLIQVVGFQSRFVGYLNTLNILVLPAFVYLWVRCRAVTPLAVLVAVSAVLGLLMAGIKAYIIFGLVAAFITRVGLSRRIADIARLGLLIGIVFGFFVAYNLIIDFLVFGRQYPLWYPPYLYVSASWPALGQLLDFPPSAPSEYTGLYTFYALWKVWNLFAPDPNFPSFIQEFREVPMRWNTYTLSGDVFLDFGLAGVFGCMLGLGWLAVRVRRYALGSDRFTAYLLWAVVGYGVVMSFFVPFLFHSYTVAFVAYLGAWHMIETRWLRRTAAQAGT